MCTGPGTWPGSPAPCAQSLKLLNKLPPDHEKIPLVKVPGDLLPLILYRVLVIYPRFGECDVESTTEHPFRVGWGLMDLFPFLGTKVSAWPHVEYHGCIVPHQKLAVYTVPETTVISQFLREPIRVLKEYHGIHLVLDSKVSADMQPVRQIMLRDARLNSI